MQEGRTLCIFIIVKKKKKKSISASELVMLIIFIEDFTLMHIPYENQLILENVFEK